jgi:isoleucyl-tRNA synthetase
LLSTWYIRRNRRRFWKQEQSDDKLSAYYTLYETLLTLCKLLAPIIPFFSEAIYRNLTKNSNNNQPESVHLCTYPKVKKSLVNQQLNNDMVAVLEVVRLGRAARNESKIRLRQPLCELLIWCKNHETESVIKKFENELKEELNVKKIRFVTNPEKYLELQLKPNYQVLGPKLKTKVQQINNDLQKLNQEQIMNAYYHQNQLLEILLSTNSEKITLKLNHDLLLVAKPKGTHFVAISNNYAVAINVKLSQDLVLEGLARDFIRHVQNLRRKNNFNVNDQIVIDYNAETELAKAIAKFTDYIQSETLATKITKTKFSDEMKTITSNGYSFSIQIEKA